MEGRTLRVADRIVITCLPDGFIYHIETSEGRIQGGMSQARDFDSTIADIKFRECLATDESALQGAITVPEPLKEV